MSMIDEQLIERKLRRIEEFLRELSLASIESFDAFRADTVVKRFIERNIELSIEQMVDICKHLVSGLDLKEPETYAQCFEILAEAGVFPASTVDIFKSMARFRNLLIHAYDGVDDAITYGIYKNQLKDFGIFVRTIREYLQPDDRNSAINVKSEE